MEGKIIKTKALASDDELILATKRGNDYRPVPKGRGELSRNSGSSGTLG